MNYKKIVLIIIVILIISGVVYYFVNKSKKDKALETTIQTINNNTGTTTPPPPVTGLQIGDTLLSKYDNIEVYREDWTVFKKVNAGEYVGRLDGNYEYHNAFYKISTPSTATGTLRVAKIAVKK